MQNCNYKPLAIVVVIGATSTLSPTLGDVRETQAQLAPAGTVGIPEPGVYAGLFSPANRNVAAEQYRPFLVLAPEESPEEVVAQVRKTKPLAANPYRIRMPEWPESIEFVAEMKAAMAGQRAIQTDRWADLRNAFNRYRDLADRKDISSLHLHISFNKSHHTEWITMKIYDSAASDRSLSMVFRGRDRRLSRFTASDGRNEVVIAFYDNGVPFILHSRGHEGVLGWQVRWLPNGKVARAIHLEDPWTPPGDKRGKGGAASPGSG